MRDNVKYADKGEEVYVLACVLLLAETNGKSELSWVCKVEKQICIRYKLIEYGWDEEKDV